MNKEEALEILHNFRLMIAEECELREALDMATEALQQDKCSSCQYAIAHGEREALDMAIEALNRPHGEWKWANNGCCSECGFHNTNFDYNFCPNCGADMRGGTE